MNDKLATFEFNSAQNFSKLTRRVEILESKVGSENKSLNLNLDGVFNYKDERIESFTEIYKTANLDHQFKLVYDHLESQLAEAKNDWDSLQPNPN